jgi:condensin complex subunit 2
LEAKEGREETCVFTITFRYTVLMGVLILEAEAVSNAPKQKREKKEAFKLDFSNAAFSEKELKEIEKELFTPATRGAGINLPGSGAGAAAAKARKKTARNKKGKNKVKEKKDDYCLPDDMHFTSRQLVTLFLKPKFSVSIWRKSFDGAILIRIVFKVKMRGERVRLNPVANGEVDEHFWAQAAADQAAGRAAANEDGDESQPLSLLPLIVTERRFAFVGAAAIGEGGIPFNTQFFHDDDDYGFDDLFHGDGDAMGSATAGVAGIPEADAGEEDLLAATQGQMGRRVRPEFVEYAKRAKRVDVKKLKENIWKGLDIVVDKDNQVRMVRSSPWGCS